MSKVTSSDSVSAEIAANYRAKEEEKERLKTDNEKEIEYLKKNYDQEKTVLADRFEKSIANDKSKFYENTRTQKRQLQRAEDELSRKKDEVIGKRESELQHEQIVTELDGKKHVDDTKSRFAQAVAYEEKTGQENQALAKSHYSKSANSIVAENDSKIGELYAQKQNELAFTSERNKEAIDQIHAKFQGQQNETQGTYDKQVRLDQNKVQADLNKRRLQNAQIMGAYSARQADPFYQMVKPDAQITESKEAFTLRIRVPEHERDSVRVQISGQELQITGTRANNEKAEIAPGNWVSTSTYQNYTEKYPLSVPVDAKSIMMHEEGDELVYEILKFGPQHRQFAAELQAEKDKRVETLTNVDFPKSLVQASARGRGPRGTIS